MGARLTMIDSHKEQLLCEILNAHANGVANAWLDQALNTHRFTLPEHYQACSFRELIIDTRKFFLRAIHPDKVPMEWKNSPEHANAVDTVFKFVDGRLQEKLQACATYPNMRHL